MQRFSKYGPLAHTLVLPAIVVVVGVAAFGLGRLAAPAGGACATVVSK